jgi:hypothetical protein
LPSSSNIFLILVFLASAGFEFAVLSFIALDLEFYHKLACGA